MPQSGRKLVGIRTGVLVTPYEKSLLMEFRAVPLSPTWLCCHCPTVTWPGCCLPIPLQHFDLTHSASMTLLHLNLSLETLLFLNEADFNSDSKKYLLSAFRNFRSCKCIPFESDFFTWVIHSRELVQSSSALEEQHLSFNYQNQIYSHIKTFLNTHHL